MDTRLEAKLMECLTALDQGESIDQVLARYPDDTAQLRPMLMTAQALPAMRLEPSEATKMKSRDAFLQQAAALRRAPRRSAGFLPRFATSLIASVMVLTIVGVGAVAASGSALPGDPLYGLKRTIENVRLALSPDDLSRGALAAQFDQTRIDEVKSLVNADRSAGIEFNGTIQSIQPNTWIVAGVEVFVGGTTEIVGTPALGSHAHVVGTTGASGVVAASIVIQTISTPTPTPRVDNTPTPQPTIENTPAPTMPRPSPAPTATPEPIEFSGVVQTIGATAWTIDGAEVQVNGSTQIDSGISIGQNVAVKALKFADGRVLALQITRADQGGNTSPNANTNENQNGNENHNENGNSNGNDNSNSNSNENSNSNDDGNGNQVSNSNSNENSNSNDDGNGNQHGNDNNGNSNHNGNEHSNSNGSGNSIN